MTFINLKLFEKIGSVMSYWLFSTQSVDARNDRLVLLGLLHRTNH